MKSRTANKYNALLARPPQIKTCTHVIRDRRRTFIYLYHITGRGDTDESAMQRCENSKPPWSPLADCGCTCNWEFERNTGRRGEEGLHASFMSKPIPCYGREVQPDQRERDPFTRASDASRLLLHLFSACLRSPSGLEVGQWAASLTTGRRIQRCR